MKKPRRILFVFGTRPEAIKMAPVILELKKYPDAFKPLVCVTAQHREMLDQVMQWFDIVPDADLDLMKPKQDLFYITSNVIKGLKDVYDKLKPDLVLVQGDTTTCLMAGMAAYYKKIPVGHIEAGLRTGDIFSPFPEEFNRRAVSILADYHFAPTALSRDNLIKEQIDKHKIHVTGNTVVDALFYSVEKVRKKCKPYASFKSVNMRNPIVLVTAHRRESFGQGLINICKAVKTLAGIYKNHEFVFPVHLNPSVQYPVKEWLSGIDNVDLLAPLNYEEFVYLLDKSYLVLTDSGGIQEEAPSLGKPVLVMREKTERPEAVKAGTVKLVGTEVNKIIEETEKLIENHKAYDKMSKAHNPYGDGKASERIRKIIEK